MTEYGEKNLTYDVNDAWSRFHHQQNVLELALESLAAVNIETDRFSDSEEETFGDPDEHERFVQDRVESQIMEREIAKRVLLQSLVASIYGTFEFSIIQLFANFERVAKRQTEVSHGPGIDLSTGKKFNKKLRSEGIELSAYDQYHRIELAKEIRHAVMHRGGLVDLNMKEKDKEYYVALLKALREGWPISGTPYAGRDDLVQIDMDPAFVRNLLSVSKTILDRVNADLVAKLDAKSCE